MIEGHVWVDFTKEVSQPDAVKIVETNSRNYNVYTLLESDAISLANSAGNKLRATPAGGEIHDTNGDSGIYYYHHHATVNGDRGHTHIYFGVEFRIK